MSQRVNVPGKGVVEFPDEMSQEQIESALQDELGGGTDSEPKTSAAGAFLSQAGLTAIPGVAGAATGLGGWELGVMMAPRTKGLSLAIPIVTSGVGALLGTEATARAQEQNIKEAFPGFHAYAQEAAQEHPTATGLGQLASMAATFQFEPANLVRGAIALPRYLRGVANPIERRAVQSAAMQTGIGAAFGVAAPLLEGRAPTARDIWTQALFANLFGHSRIPGLRPGPLPEAGTDRQPNAVPPAGEPSTVTPESPAALGSKAQGQEPMAQATPEGAAPQTAQAAPRSPIQQQFMDLVPEGAQHLVTVHEDPNTLPGSIQAEMTTRKLPLSKAEGGLDVDSGTLHYNLEQFLNEDGTLNTQKVQNKVTHEVLVHYGIRQAIGDTGMARLAFDVWDSLPETDRATVAKNQSIAPDRLDVIGEEWLAVEAERVAREGTSNSLWARIVTRLKQLIRPYIGNFGGFAKYSDLEIARLVALGMAGVEAGAPGAARGEAGARMSVDTGALQAQAQPREDETVSGREQAAAVGERGIGPAGEPAVPPTSAERAGRAVQDLRSAAHAEGLLRNRISPASRAATSDRLTDAALKTQGLRNAAEQATASHLERADREFEGHMATMPRRPDGSVDFRAATTEQLDRMFALERARVDAIDLNQQVKRISSLVYPPHSEFLKRVDVLDRKMMQDRLQGLPPEVRQQLEAKREARLSVDQSDESVDRALYDYSERTSNHRREVMQDFVAGNKEVAWKRVPAETLKKIWLEYGKRGSVSDLDGLLRVKERVLENIARLKAITELVAHTEVDPKRLMSDEGIELSDKQWDAFWNSNYITNQFSDYAFRRLEPLYTKIHEAETPDELVPLIDRVLNVVHQRGDLAEHFVEGGTKTLNHIAKQGGYVEPEASLSEPVRLSVGQDKPKYETAEDAIKSLRFFGRPDILKAVAISGGWPFDFEPANIKRRYEKYFGRGLQGAVETAAKEETDPLLKAVAKTLAKANVRTTLTPSAGTSIADTFRGQYRYHNDSADLNPYLKDAEFRRAVIHEALHSVTMRNIIDSTPEFASRLVRLVELAREKAPPGTEPHGKFYGLLNVFEFVSEAISNPEFQAFLKSIPYEQPAGKISTLWKRIVSVVRRLLSPDGTLLEAAVEHAMEAASIDYLHETRLSVSPEHEQDMDLARRIPRMTGEQFRAEAKSFNRINLRLGREATPQELRELASLRDLATDRLESALRQFSRGQTPEAQHELEAAMTMPQFFNEALAEAQKVVDRNRGGDLISTPELGSDRSTLGLAPAGRSREPSSSVSTLNAEGVPVASDGGLNATKALLSVENLDAWLKDFEKDPEVRKIFTPEDIASFAKGAQMTKATFGDDPRVMPGLDRFLRFRLPGKQWPRRVVPVPGLQTEEQARRAFMRLEPKAKFLGASIASPFRENSDPLFEATFDLSTICPQQDLYVGSLRQVEAALGRVLSPQERFGVGRMLDEIGLKPSCWYCYGQGGRDRYDFFVQRAADVVNAAHEVGLNPAAIERHTGESPSASHMAIAKLALDLGIGKLNGPKLLDLVQGRAVVKGQKQYGFVRLVQNKAQSSTLANSPKGRVEYWRQLLDNLDLRGEVQNFNKSAGIRMNSQTDFRPWHVLDAAQMMAHLQAIGGMAHVYTRIPDFIRIFGDTGIKFNMSSEVSSPVDMPMELRRTKLTRAQYKELYKKYGEPTWNDMNGMPHELGQQFRREHPNTVGTMLVPVDHYQVWWGLDNPEVDMMIPFHQGAVKPEVTEHMGGSDFTKQQHEHFPDDWKAGQTRTRVMSDGSRVTLTMGSEKKAGKVKRIPPTITREQHQNSRERYIELSEKFDFEPRYKDFIEHPNYMKLVRDVAREPSTQSVVDATKINWSEAQRVISAWVKKGGQEADITVDPKVLKNLLYRIEVGDWPKSDVPVTRDVMPEDLLPRRVAKDVTPQQMLPKEPVKAGGRTGGAMIGEARLSVEKQKDLAGEDLNQMRLDINPQVEPRLFGVVNAITDYMRERFDLGERELPGVLGNRTVAQKALRIDDRDPSEKQRLADEVRANPNKMLEPHETALIAMHGIKLEQDLAYARKALADAHAAGGSPEMLAGKLSAADQARDRLLEWVRVAEKSGTALGRGLQIRKALYREDFSYAGIIGSLEHARGGRPFDPNNAADAKVLEQAQKLAEDYKAASDKWKAAFDKEQKARVEADAKAQTERLRREAATTMDPRILEAAQKLVGDLRQKRETRLAEIKKRGLSFADVPPPIPTKPVGEAILSVSKADLDELYTAAADVGAAHLTDRGVSREAWNARMAQDFGPSVTPHLDHIWELSNGVLDNLKAKVRATRAKPAEGVAAPKAPPPQDPVTKQVRLVEAMREANADGMEEGELRNYIRAVIKNVVESGVKDYDAIHQQAHDILTDAGVNITPDQMKQKFSGYGEAEPAPTEPTRVRMAQLRQETQKALGLQDLLTKNERPAKSGKQRVAASDLYRRTLQQINEAMKRLGIVTRDAAAQMRSILDARKTYTRNRIKDLRFEIASGEKIVKEKAVPLTDEELNGLRRELAEVKAEHAARFPKQPRSPEQQLAFEERLAQGNLNQWEKKLELAKRGVFNGAFERSDRLKSAKLEAVKARTAAIRAEYRELLELTPAFQAEQAVRALIARKQALEEQIAEKQRKLATGDVGPTPRPERPVPPELQALVAQRDALNKQLQEARRAPAPSPEERALQGFKRARLNEIARLREREAQMLASGKPWKASPRKKVPFTMDTEATRLQDEAKEIGMRVKELTYRLERENRTPLAKTLDFLTSWSKMALIASGKVYPKLALAGITRIAADPVYRLLGQPLRLLDPAVAAKSEGHLGLNPMTEAVALTKLISTLGQTGQKFRRGMSSIDVAAGKVERHAAELGAFVARSHGMVKEPFRQVIFYKALRYHLSQLERAGADISNPLVIQMAKASAASEANRNILMSPNLATQYLIRLPIAALKAKGTRPALALASVWQFLMPIVTVPTNMAWWSLRLTPYAGVEYAARRITAAREGMTPERAVELARVFKTGMLGVLLGAYAWLNPDKFGGELGEPGRKKGQRPPGEMEVFGVTLPGWLSHHPEGAFLNDVASARRVYDRFMIKNPDDELNGDVQAFFFTVLTPIKQFPVIGNFLRDFSERVPADVMVAKFVQSRIIPSGIGQALDLATGERPKIKTGLDVIKQFTPMRADMEMQPED